jgi:preprotein translocase subunit SecA
MGLIDSLIKKFFGSKSDRDIKEVQPIVDKVLEEYAKLSTLSNDQLRELSNNLKLKIRTCAEKESKEIDDLKIKIEDPDLDIKEKEKFYEQIEKLNVVVDNRIKDSLDDALPLAFAIIKDTARRFTENEKLEVTATDFDRELAAKRNSIVINGEKAYYNKRWLAGGNEISWDMVHYDVQLIGGVVLHQGKISEMSTGEGKTLVATLPVFLNALSGRGVHIVTVNDYLAKRDSEWMGTLYEFHGLSVDCIDRHQPNSEARRKAYLADITFGTNNEFGFDYLRDNMSSTPEELVQRVHNYAIVDEVDSVLIDDARTPLIISGPVPRGENQEFETYRPKVETLVNAQRKLVTQILADAKKALESNNKEEKEKGSLLLLRAFKGLPKNKALIKFLSEEGNKNLMHKTENFYMQDNNKQMHIVTDELYFVIDEKNNSIELTDKGLDIITTSSEDASFFILPDIGSEIADIEKKITDATKKLEVKEQLLQDYAIKSERVHTVNQLLKAYTLFEKDDEYVVMDNKVKIVDEQTGRILEGRRYSDGLHQAIEAKERVHIEAATQTFATVTLQNYFRMYKKLAGMTGTAETEAGEFWNIYKLDVVVIPTNKAITRKDEEDKVYKTKREKYNAVIDEIASLVEKGRPVLVGTTSVEISELLSRMLKMRGIKHNVLNAKLHQREAEIVAEAGQSKTVTIATNMAGRGTDIKLSEEVRQAGGLAIIGTERHESRRVDRQLRGRAGRQGDPGSSQFFVCLEDDLMRLFGSDRIAAIMDRMGIQEGEVIQHSMISRSIERAQKKVEENNFGIRKRLLEYDDVMNSQREVIYKRRRHALYGERLSLDISNMMYDICDNLVNQYQNNSDFEEFNLEVIKVLSIEAPFTADEFSKSDTNELIEKLHAEIWSNYRRKNQALSQKGYPAVKDVYENQSGQYENIVFPITDGAKTYQIIINLKKAYESQCLELVRAYEKAAVLITIDDAWREHLREMDDLKQSVQNAAYEQKDPLLIYKFESFELFRTMVDTINKHVASMLVKGHIQGSEQPPIQRASAPKKIDMSKFSLSKSEAPSSLRGNRENPGEQHEERKVVQPIRTEKKVGRNDPCPCGSGKKYKSCHGVRMAD